MGDVMEEKDDDLLIDQKAISSTDHPVNHSKAQPVFQVDRTGSESLDLT